MSYMSVYVSRGIESISHGPCWSIKNQTEPAPSEQQLEAESFGSDSQSDSFSAHAGIFNFLSNRSKQLIVGQTWESDIDSTEALAELNQIAGQIA